MIKKFLKNKYVLMSFFVLFLIGVTYAYFSLDKTSLDNSRLVAGDIYMSMKTKTINIKNELYPMESSEGIIGGVKYDFSVSGYNTSNHDIYYGIYINKGESNNNKIRLKDSDIMMVLKETSNNETKTVYGPGSLEEFNKTLIHANKIEGNLEDKVVIDYELTTWISEKVLITNTETDILGRSIYTEEDYRNSYASLNVLVAGDFETKQAISDEVTLEAYTKSDLINYITSLDYQETPYVNDSVIVRIMTNKEPSKLIITNELNNQREELTFTKDNNKWIYEKEEDANGKYSYYIEYKDTMKSDIYHYNVRIDRHLPMFQMELGKRIKVGSSEETVQISNVISNISDDNNITLKYALVNKGQIPQSYKEVINNKNSYEIIEEVSSGIYELYVILQDDSGKTYESHVTYHVSYDIALLSNEVTFDKGLEVILGYPLNYLESLQVKEIDGYEFIGWKKKKNDSVNVSSEMIVTKDIKYLYALYRKLGSNIVVTFISNGASISKESDTCFALAGGSCEISFPTITRNDFQILGWSEEKNGYNSLITNDKVSVSSDKIYYAQTLKDVSVTFNINGALSLIKSDNTITTQNSVDTCKIYNENTSCSIKSLVINAKDNTPTVLGWNENKNGYSSTWDINTLKEFSDSKVYYAQTMISSKMYNASYTKDEGILSIGKTNDSCTIASSYNGINQASSCLITLPSITKNTNYNILGWFKDNTKMGDAGNQYNLSSNESLVAKSSAVNLSETSSNVTYGSGSKTISVFGSNYGTLSCQTNDSNVGTCSVNGNIVTIIPNNVGTTIITINTTEAGSITHTLTVNKKSINIMPNSNQKKVYGETNPVLSYSYSPPINGETAKFEGSLSRVAGENVGIYLINLGTLKLIDNGSFIASNYNLVLESNVNFTITVKTVTIPNSNSNKTYNGLSQTNGIITPTGSTIVSDISVTEAINAGTYSVIYRLDNENYIWSDGTTTNKSISWIIDKKTLIWSTKPIVNSKSYDGNNLATISSHGIISGIIDSNTCTLVTTTAKATFNNEVAGVNKSITFKGYSITGTNAINYILELPTDVVGTINKADPVITINPLSDSIVAGKSMTFNESANIIGSFNNISLSQNIASVSPQSYIDVLSNTSKEVTINGITGGTSTINITFNPSDITNYNSITVTYVANILKSVSIPTNSLCEARTYDGTMQTLTSVTNGVGYILNGYSQTNAGEYDITATLEDGYRFSDNSVSSKSFTCTMNKANAALTSVIINGKNYVGEILRATVNYVSDGLLTYSWYINDSNSTVGGTLIESNNDGELGIITSYVGKYIYVLVTIGEGNNYLSSTNSISDITDSSNNTYEVTTEFANIYIYHYQQNADFSGYTKVSTDGDITPIIVGVGSLYTAKVNIYKNFITPTMQTITVESGDNIIEYYYNRNNCNGEYCNYCEMDDNLGDCLYSLKDNVTFLNDSIINLNLWSSGLNYDVVNNNYRVIGNNTDIIDNYVCFGTVNDCTNVNFLHRIIGVFNPVHNVRLILPSTSYNTYYNASADCTVAFSKTNLYTSVRNHRTNATYGWTSSINSSNLWNALPINVTNYRYCSSGVGNYATETILNFENSTGSSSYTSNINVILSSDMLLSTGLTTLTFNNGYSKVATSWLYGGQEWTQHRFNSASAYLIGSGANAGKICANSTTGSTTGCSQSGYLSTSTKHPFRPHFTLSENTLFCGGTGKTDDPIILGYGNEGCINTGVKAPNAQYIVNHYQMNADGENYTLIDTTTHKSSVGMSVTIAPKQLNNYIIPQSQTIILTTATQTVNYYYDLRNVIASKCTIGSNLGNCIVNNISSLGLYQSGLSNDTDSYRYIGIKLIDEPINYLCFGTKTSCSASNYLHRIIGVFGTNNQLKLNMPTSRGTTYYASASGYKYTDSHLQDAYISDSLANAWKTTYIDETNSWYSLLYRFTQGQGIQTMYNMSANDILHIEHNTAGYTFNDYYYPTSLSDLLLSQGSTTLKFKTSFSVISNSWLILNSSEWSWHRFNSAHSQVISKDGKLCSNSVELDNDYGKSYCTLSGYSSTTIKHSYRLNYMLNSSVVYCGGSGTSINPIIIGNGSCN